MRNLARAALSLGLLLGIAPARAADPTTVFAAASLKNAAASAPARQIEQGAPADLERMDYLAARELIRPETRANLLNNRLVAVVPRAAPAIAAAAKMTARSIDRDIVSPDRGCVCI